MKEPGPRALLQDQEARGQATCFGRPLLDALLLSVSLVLLVTVGVMLKADSPWEAPDSGGALGDTSRRLMLSLGMALFLVSLLVCMYAMTRLGFCCNTRDRSRARLRRGIPSVNSSVQLIPATDLPPTYDTVAFSRADSQPPPYYTITFQCERGARPAEVG